MTDEKQPAEATAEPVAATADGRAAQAPRTESDAEQDEEAPEDGGPVTGEAVPEVVQAAMGEDQARAALETGAPAEGDADEEDEEDEGAAAGPALDLAALGRRYAVAAGFADTLRDGFRELKRRPSEARRLSALMRGLARKHEPEAQRVIPQITRLVERIQAPPKSEA